MPLTQETFAALVLEDTDGRWEIHRQRLREKPPMSFGHNRAARLLTRTLIGQLPSEFEVLGNDGHVGLPNGDSYIPDVAVVPPALTVELTGNPRQFERYVAPLPFVAEVWSPSTGSYDIDGKIPGYRSRGDAEIWRIHPFERTVTIWRRRPDGGYDEQIVTGGVLELTALPGVFVDIERLFATPE